MDGYLLDALRRKQKSVEDLALLPPGDGFLLVEFGGCNPGRSQRQSPRPRRLPQNPQPRTDRPHLHLRRSQARLAHPRVRPRRHRLHPRRRHRLGGLGRRRRRSHSTRQLPPPDRRAHEGVRLPQRHVRPLRPGLRPHAPQLRPRNPRRHPQVPPVHRPRRRHRPRSRRLALRRTRRRPGPRRPPAQDVRPRAHGGLPHLQAHLRPHQPHEPRQAHRRPSSPTKTSASAPTTTPGSPKPTSPSPKTTAASPPPTSAASASEPAAKPTPAPCAPASWPPAKNSTPPAAAPICSGSSCRAKSSPTNGRTSRSKSPSTSASPAKPASPSAPSPSTWPPTRPSSSPTTTKANPRPLSHYAFGRIDVFARLAGYSPRLVNAVNNAPILSSIIKEDPPHPSAAASFPRFCEPFTPDRRLARDPRRRRDRRIPLPPEAPEVFLWADTFNNYFHPSAMRAAHQRPHHRRLPRHPPQAAPLLRPPPLRLRHALTPPKTTSSRSSTPSPRSSHAGTPIVVLEPSCASVFRDELTNLLPHDPRAAKLRDQTFLLSEFLVKHAPNYKPPQIDGKIIVHGHCHHRATMGMHDELALLRLTGADVELLDSGCCGMAGPFGFEKDKYDVSQTLGERVLLPAVRNKRRQHHPRHRRLQLRRTDHPEHQRQTHAPRRSPRPIKAGLGDSAASLSLPTADIPSRAKPTLNPDDADTRRSLSHHQTDTAQTSIAK